MRRFLVLAAFLVGLAVQYGCGDSVALSGRERWRNYKRGLEMERRMLNDDIDHFLLADRPSRLNKWRVE